MTSGRRKSDRSAATDTEGFDTRAIVPYQPERRPCRAGYRLAKQGFWLCDGSDASRVENRATTPSSVTCTLSA